MREDGFIILEFPDKEIINKSKAIQSEINSEKFHNHTELRNDTNDRLQDAFKIKEVHEIAINEEIIKLLTNLYGKKLFLFKPLLSNGGHNKKLILIMSILIVYLKDLWLEFGSLSKI